MFGYIYPDKPELRIMDYAAFQAHYCGLCKTLKKEFNFVSRLLLNYDCTFLYVLLNALFPEKSDIRQEHCAFVPFRKKTVIYGAGRSYAAGVNVILAFNKALDNIRDEKRVKSYLFRAFYKGTYRRAKKAFPHEADIVERRLLELSELEKRGCSDIDEVADVFSRMLGGILKNAPGFSEKDQRKLYHLGYNLGRWIYLIDALDDIEKDVKDNAYNIFLVRYGFDGNDVQAFKNKQIEELEFNLYYSLSEAAKAFELLDIQKNRQLLENIIYMGLKKKTRALLEGGKGIESVPGTRRKRKRNG